MCESTQLYELCKACSSLKIMLRSGNICTNVIAGSRRSVAKRRCHTGNAPDQALSISSACGRLVSRFREESPGLGTSPCLALRNTAPQNRVAALLPRTVTVPRYLTPGGVVTKAYVPRTPSMHLDCRNAFGFGFESLKTGFPAHYLCARCAALLAVHE